MLGDLDKKISERDILEKKQEKKEILVYNNEQIEKLKK